MRYLKRLSSRFSEAAMLCSARCPRLVASRASRVGCSVNATVWAAQFDGHTSDHFVCMNQANDIHRCVKRVDVLWSRSSLRGSRLIPNANANEHVAEPLAEKREEQGRMPDV